MKGYKILALMYADFLLVKNSKWRIVEYLYFPISTVLIYGLFSVFVRQQAFEAGIIVLIVNIYWSFAQLAQSHVNMSMNEDSWSGSLKQIIASGVSDFEYIISRVISSIFFSIFVLLLMIVVSVTLFGISLFITHWPEFLVIALATLIASIAMSIFFAGAMIALGREYSFLAWTALQAVIFLSAPFYPVSLFPEIMRPVVSAMPYANIFEASRTVIGGAAAWNFIWLGLFVAVIYLLSSLPFYKYVFAKAREKGWLVRLS